MSRIAIDGFCPMCGKRSLAVEVSLVRGPTARVRCYHPDCPDPEGIDKLMQDSEVHHILDVNEWQTWTLKHPLRERINGNLFECPLHGFLRQEFAFRYPPEQGRYRYVSTNTEDQNYGPWEAEKL